MQRSRNHSRGGTLEARKVFLSTVRWNSRRHSNYL